MTSSAYGQTSGTDNRESRPMMDRLLVFDLESEIARLRGEPEWAQGDRNSLMLAKEVDFRVLLSVLRAGATLDERDGDARVSVQVLKGHAGLRVDGAGETELSGGQLATIDVGQAWYLTATEESAVLLTFAWPREKAGV
jgi:hypothetical protein